MKALAVSHNGQKVAVVGTPENGSVMVQVHGIMMAELRQTEANFGLQVIRSTADDEKRRPDIWRRLNLSVGDEITIRIVDVESEDRPLKHVPNRPKQPPHRENQGNDFDFDSRFGRFN